MGQVIGQLLPLAVGVAISPLPVIAAILMLLSPRARTVGVGFLVGWVGGIVVALVVAVLLAGLVPAGSPGQPHLWAGVLQIVLGVLLLLIGSRQWRSRPRAGAEPVMPAWMGAVDRFSPARAAGLAFALAGLNPKNLLLALSAGRTIDDGWLAAGGVAVAALVFVVLASSSVVVPVVGYLVAGARLGTVLEELKSWLVAHNAVIMTVLLLVLGVMLVGKGIGQL